MRVSHIQISTAELSEYMCIVISLIKSRLTTLPIPPNDSEDSGIAPVFVWVAKLANHPILRTLCCTRAKIRHIIAKDCMKISCASLAVCGELGYCIYSALGCACLSHTGGPQRLPLSVINQRAFILLLMKSKLLLSPTKVDSFDAFLWHHTLCLQLDKANCIASQEFCSIMVPG